MTIRVPWPKGLSEEEKQKRIEERKIKEEQSRQQERAALAQAIAERDVWSLTQLALATIQRMLRPGSDGIRLMDVSDLTKLTQELCVVGTIVLGSCPGLLALSTILKTVGDGLARRQPGKSFSITLAAAAKEVNVMHVAAELERRTSQLPSPPQEVSADRRSPLQAPGTMTARQETHASHNTGQDPSDESSPRSPKKSPTKRGSVSHDRGFEAVKLASKWDKEGRAWTQRDLAAELGLDRSQLFGTSRGGQPRCPVIASYWEKRQREKLQRKQNMASHNRTGHVDGED